MIMARNNKQIWRLARYLFDIFESSGDWVWDSSEYSVHTDQISQSYKNKMYDKSVELQRKLQNNGFTGDDDHD